MRQLCRISRCTRWLRAVGLAVGVGLGLLPFNADPSDDYPIMMGHSTFDVISPASIALETEKRWVSAVSIPADTNVLLRTLPSLSKQISFGGTRLVPYIGAGFRGGYATEYDRSLNTALVPSFSSSGPADIGLRSLAGHMIPNEVQMGLRFPF